MGTRISDEFSDGELNGTSSRYQPLILGIRRLSELVMIYKHIDSVTVSAQFAWEGELRFRYRLEIVLKDAVPTGKTACVVMQNPSYAGEDVADKSVQFMEKVIFKRPS